MKRLAALFALIGLVWAVTVACTFPDEPTPPSAGATQLDPTGLQLGLSNWPLDWWCSGGMTGFMQTASPTGALSNVKRAASCGRAVVIVPQRKMLTSNGLNNGPFSVTAAKRWTDAMAKVFTPAVLATYGPNIIGANLADDYACASCWGGHQITQAQIEEWAAYTRSKMPGMPLGVRVTADWVAARPSLAKYLDYSWAQWHKGKGNKTLSPSARQLDWYGRAARAAQSLGLKMVAGFNTEDCGGGSGSNSTPACTADEVQTFGTNAITFSYTCASLQWTYKSTTWGKADIRAAWTYLQGLARQQATRSCRKAGTV